MDAIIRNATKKKQSLKKNLEYELILIFQSVTAYNSPAFFHLNQ